MNCTSWSTRPMLQSDGGEFSCPFHTKTLHRPCVRRGGELARAVRVPQGPRRRQRHSLVSDAKRQSTAPLASQRRGGLRGGCVPAACRGWIPATRGRRRRRRTMPRTIPVLLSRLFLAIVATDTKAAFGHSGKPK